MSEQQPIDCEELARQRDHACAIDPNGEPCQILTDAYNQNCIEGPQGATGRFPAGANWHTLFMRMARTATALSARVLDLERELAGRGPARSDDAEA
jgi:hypothetical protein